MNDTSILVLGAGELGLPVIRNLAKRAALSSGTTVAVLLRHSSINSDSPGKQRDLDELRALGVNFLAGDLTASTAELSAVFKNFDTVISCTGFVTGAGGFQLKLARAVLDAGVKRYFPGSSASITTLSAEAARRICSTSSWTCAICCVRKTARNGSSFRRECSPASCLNLLLG